MPSFASGVASQSSLQNSLTNRRQVQLQAERDKIAMQSTKRIEDQQDNTMAAIQAEADSRIEELRERAMIGGLDAAFEGVANRNFDSLNDFMADPENMELVQGMPALTEAFGDSIKSVRQFNPNSDNDIAARNLYAQELSGGKSDYETSPDGLKKFIDDNVVAVDLAGGGTELVRSDEFLELLGTTERRTSARRVFNTKNDEIARIMRETEEAKLSVLNPAYKGKGDGKSQVEISTEAAAAYKRLIDAKADPALIGELMSAFGVDVNEPHIQEQLNLGVAADKMAIAKDGAAASKAAADIAQLASDAEQLEAYNSIGANSGYGANSGALVKDLIDTGKYGVEGNRLVQLQSATKTPARLQYLSKAEDAVAEFNTKLIDYEVGEDGKPKYTWQNYQEWPQELKDDAALYADKYDTLTESSPLPASMKTELATLNQTLFASGRFVEEGQESTTGPVDSAINILNTYRETDDQDRRIEKSQELAGILVAASLNDRTSKYLFERVANVFGSSYGQSFESALGGAELFLNTQKAKVDAIRNETTNPFTRARLDFYSSKIDESLGLARQKLGLQEVKDDIQATPDFVEPA